MDTARATYTVKSWDEETVRDLDEGGKITRASVAGSYKGDVEGEGRSESVMWYRPDSTATFVALERIEGRIGERRGSFMLRSVGEYDGRDTRARQEIVTGSDTGDLEGFEGKATFQAPPGHQGTLELDYEIGGA